MTEPTNAVLAEKIQRIREEFVEHKRETRAAIKELDEDLTKTRRIADDVNVSMNYVKDTVQEMKSMVSGFVEMITTQNKSIDDKIGEQNTKIDAFINSDKRLDNKRQFFVAILQVAGGIIIAILGMWGAGKL